MIGLPDMRPESLRKAMIEPVKVMAPMAAPSDISTRLCGVDRARHADAEGFRRVEGGRRHQHRRQADQRMERRDQLRHRRHGDAPRDHRADAAADGDAADDHRPGQRRLGPRHGKRGEHGDGHAGHAEIIAPARGLGRRQPAQRQDEQDAGDEIEQRDEIVIHDLAASHFFFF